jgi:RNA-binding protein 48
LNFFSFVKKNLKVYTCAQESNYLLVTKIPAIAVHLELVKLFKIYGDIEDYKILDDYPSEEFTDTILLKFSKIQNARHFIFIKLINF